MSDAYGREAYDDMERPAATMALASMWTGITSLACIALMFCTCYTSLFAAFPLGIVSMFTGFQALRDPSTPLLGKHMAVGGIVAASISTVISGLFLAFIALYFAMIVVIGMAGNL